MAPVLFGTGSSPSRRHPKMCPLQSVLCAPFQGECNHCSGPWTRSIQLKCIAEQRVIAVSSCLVPSRLVSSLLVSSRLVSPLSCLSLAFPLVPRLFAEMILSISRRRRRRRRVGRHRKAPLDHETWRANLILSPSSLCCQRRQLASSLSDVFLGPIL